MKAYNAIELASSTLKAYGISNIEQESKILVAHAINYCRTPESLDDLLQIDLQITLKFIQVFLLKRIIKKRCTGYPLQYITEIAGFYESDFFVNKEVMIPRPDTEILVDTVISYIKENYSQEGSSVSVLDMCSGSGNIGISIAKACSNSYITMVDKYPGPCKVANFNANRLDLLRQCSVDQKGIEDLQDLDFDIIVCNPPYISKKDLKNVSVSTYKYEPHRALFARNDGLEWYKCLIETIKHFNVKHRIFICLEIGFNQAESVSNIISKELGVTDITVEKDLSGHNRCVYFTYNN